VGNNGIGVAGITWDVQIMPVKFLDASNNGFTSNAIKGLNYALQMGAVTSNHSWGGASFSQALFDAISSARSQGHLVVAAAGNGGADSDATPFYPASYDLDNIIAVAATDRYDNLTNFSNYGATRVDLAAPGYSIYSTLPNNSYGYKSGTSMATPHVTGAAALLWQRDRSLTYSTIKSLLMSRSDALSSLQGKVVSGGRLNLASLLGTGSPTPTPSPAPSPSPSPVSSPSPTPSPSSTPTPTPEPDSIPPTVIITNPSAGAVLPKVGTVAFTAAASDNKGVSEMQLFVDGVKNKTCTGVTTCSTNLSMKKLASGSHILKAVAIDTGSPANTSDVFNTVTKP
jgi:subtilisin family serine protease